MRSVADELAELGEQRGFRAYRTDGYESASWILVDFVDVVLHLFTDEARRYYDLESLWGDAPRVEFDPAAPEPR
jgi:ribosome-associated protein